MKYKTLTDNINGIIIQRKLLVRTFDELSEKEVQYLLNINQQSFVELQKRYANKEFTVEDFENIYYTKNELAKLIEIKAW